MSCPNINVPIPEIQDINWECQPELHVSVPRYLYPPSGDREYPVLSAHQLDPGIIEGMELGIPHEVSIRATEEDRQKLLDAFPGGVEITGDGMITIKVYILL